MFVPAGFKFNLPVVRLLFPKRKLPREWRVGGDFLWMLDPDIAALMIAAMVAVLVLTPKNLLRGFMPCMGHES